MTPCLTLSNIRYVSRVKWNNPGKGVAPSPTPWCSSYWKRSLPVALDYRRQLYLKLIGRVSKRRTIIPISNFLIINRSVYQYLDMTSSLTCSYCHRNFHLLGGTNLQPTGILSRNKTNCENIERLILVYPRLYPGRIQNQFFPLGQRHRIETSI